MARLVLIKELMESPYVHDGHYPAQIHKDTVMSSNSLAREYTFIGSFEDAPLQDVRVYLRNTGTRVTCVTSEYENHSGKKVNRIVAEIRFKHTLSFAIPPELEHHELMQIDSAFVVPDYEGNGLASETYMALAVSGKVIVSDNTQFLPGKMLWKKLIEDAELNGLNVYLLDDETGFEKENGELVKVTDDSPWTEGADFNGYHKLLVLMK